MKVIESNCQTGEGGVAVIVPTPEALEQYGIEAIALKDEKMQAAIDAATTTDEIKEVLP